MWSQHFVKEQVIKGDRRIPCGGMRVKKIVKSKNKTRVYTNLSNAKEEYSKS